MVDQQRIWDEHAARNYDTPNEGMFADAVLGRPSPCWSNSPARARRSSSP